MMLTTNDYDYYELLNHDLIKVYDIKKDFKKGDVIRFKDNWDLTWNTIVSKVKKNYVLLKKY
jgi:hypothetical protein